MIAESWSNLLLQLLVKRGVIQAHHSGALAENPVFHFAKGTPIFASDVRKVYSILKELAEFFLVPTHPFGFSWIYGTLEVEENPICAEWLEENGLFLNPPLPTRGNPTACDYQNCLENAQAIVDLLNVVPLKFFYKWVGFWDEEYNLYFRKSTIRSVYSYSQNLSNTDYQHEDEGEWETSEDSERTEWWGWRGDIFSIETNTHSSAYNDPTSGLQKRGTATTTYITFPKNQSILCPNANILMQYAAEPYDYNYTFSPGDSGLSQNVFPTNFHLSYGSDSYYVPPFLRDKLHRENCLCGSALSPVVNLGRWDTSGNLTLGSTTILPYTFPTPTASHTPFDPASTYIGFSAKIALALEILWE